MVFTFVDYQAKSTKVLKGIQGQPVPQEGRQMLHIHSSSSTHSFWGMPPSPCPLSGLSIWVLSRYLMDASWKMFAPLRRSIGNMQRLVPALFVILIVALCVWVDGWLG